MRSGKVSEAVLKRSVLKEITTTDTDSTRAAYVGLDAARFDGAGSMLAATTTVTIGDGYWGLIGINRIAADIACRGGCLSSVLIDITMPVKFNEKVLKEIMRQSNAECKKRGAVIIGGHTEISDAVKRPLVSYTGIGNSRYNTESYAGMGCDKNSAAAYSDIGSCRYSMDGSSFLEYNIILTQWVGMEGAYLLTQYKREELGRRYPAWLTDFTNSLKNHLAVDAMAHLAIENKAAYIHNLSNGGVFNALWEMSSYCLCGFDIELKKIPLRQEIVEIAEYFQINPYQMLSGGCLLIVAADGERIINAFDKEGIPAVIIGKTTDNNDKIIRNEDEIRYLDSPKADELLRVL